MILQNCQRSRIFKNQVFSKLQIFFRKKPKKLLRVVKAAFNVSRGTFWGKSFFLKKLYFYNYFRTLGKSFSAGLSKLHSAGYGYRGTFGGIFLWKNVIFIINFGFRAKNFRTFGTKFSAGLSEVHSTCPDEHFRVFKNFSQAWTQLANIGCKKAPFDWMMFLPCFKYGPKIIITA